MSSDETLPDDAENETQMQEYESVGHRAYFEYVNTAPLEYGPQLAMVAVLADGRPLKYASDAVKADPAVVLAAVKRSGGDALQSASKGLQECPYLRGWAALSHKGRRNRCVREAFLHKHSERNARVQARGVLSR